MEFHLWFAPVWIGIAMVAYAAISIQFLKQTENGAIFRLERFHREVRGGGPVIVWLGLDRMERFPKGLIEHTITLPPVLPQQLESSVFYTKDGKERSFDELGDAEKERAQREPAHQRAPILVDATMVYRLPAQGLRDLIDNVGSIEKLPEKIGTILHTAVHDEFGSITTATALEHRTIVGKRITDRVRWLTGERVDTDGQLPSLGIETVVSQIGAIKVSPDVEAGYVEMSAAIARRQSGITDADMKRERIRLISEVLKTDEGRIAAFYEEKVPQKFGDMKIDLIMTDSPLTGLAAGIGKIFKTGI